MKTNLADHALPVSGVPVGIWIRVSTEDQARGESRQSQQNFLHRPLPGSAPIESVALATERNRAAAESAIVALQRARALAQENAGGELVAVELRTAIAALRSILGDFDTEALLGRVFSRFCIGK